MKIRIKIFYGARMPLRDFRDTFVWFGCGFYSDTFVWFGNQNQVFSFAALTPAHLRVFSCGLAQDGLDPGKTQKIGIPLCGLQSMALSGRFLKNQNFLSEKANMALGIPLCGLISKIGIPLCGFGGKTPYLLCGRRNMALGIPLCGWPPK
ncbi:hypothetical protein [Deinococcus roseus]|uniref:hypothetical protein n=1 Tax=Deinococcus roseus TaxID=392414 RepID=UPI001667B25A|nr:hypothetical protein [Deinococcus roseus]